LKEDLESMEEEFLECLQKEVKYEDNLTWRDEFQRKYEGWNDR